ncbi:MAG: transcriptional repressor, BirA-like [Symbiobacteriaceae bacterium]|jgi:BirA family biotin operon repressor/biotin-[acetyl-CoA-carboxylase] ligase|nr:transcriptional repressor, BirA-like [Symbiobacteriaceae bacterium]
MSSRDAVLAVLREAGERWVSGEELSRSLGVSRTAVWKLMEGLRAAGYQLEALPRQGYRLVGSPDAVTPAEITPGLATRSFGRQIEYRESVGSTNDLAKQLARAGAPEGLLVIADEQTAGKGRLGRAWTTPRGSALAMSLVLRPALPPVQAPRVTLVAAVAVAEAVRAVTGLPVGIKWPNDLQVAGRKVCGILTEMEAEIDRVAFVVCGMGLNVNLPRESLPEAFRSSATSLMAELGASVGRAPLVQAMLARFEEAYDELLSGRFAAVLERWRALSITLGQPVRVLSVTGEAAVEGLAVDVDEEGALLVRESASGVLRRVFAGEVTLRG